MENESLAMYEVSQARMGGQEGGCLAQQVSTHLKQLTQVFVEETHAGGVLGDGTKR